MTDRRWYPGSGRKFGRKVVVAVGVAVGIANEHLQIEGGRIDIVQNHDFLGGGSHAGQIFTAFEGVGRRYGAGIHRPLEMAIGYIQRTGINRQPDEEEQHQKRHREDDQNLALAARLAGQIRAWVWASAAPRGGT